MPLEFNSGCLCCLSKLGEASPFLRDTCRDLLHKEQALWGSHRLKHCQGKRKHPQRSKWTISYVYNIYIYIYIYKFEYDFISNKKI